jgi:hypothetical protein
MFSWRRFWFDTTGGSIHKCPPPLALPEGALLPAKMDEPRDYQLVSADQTALKKEIAKPDPGATPFKVVVDPEMRLKLRRALVELIDYHDEALAEHFAEGKLALESYKEYIELFARSLKETMESREGVSYLLRAVGFDVPPEDINLHPDLRWKRGKPGGFGSSLL